jgi:hypothetical protein
MMALEIGDVNASSGLTQAIFVVMERELGDNLGDLEPPDADKVKEAWRKLSLAIAEGVIEHFRGNSGDAFAEVVSSASDDAIFWKWLAGFAAVFDTWATSGGNPATLQSGLQTFFSNNDTPDELRGRVE